MENRKEVDMENATMNMHGVSLNTKLWMKLDSREHDENIKLLVSVRGHGYAYKLIRKYYTHCKYGSDVNID